MKFGETQTIKEKMAIAAAKGYDTGRPSAGAKPPPKPKVKPKLGKDKIGATAYWKF